MIISEMTSVTDLLLEILKCRLIHMGSHQLGSKHTARYDNQLAIPPVLVYGNKFGTEHRDVKQILQLYEVQYFLACGKACGGFNGRATLKALEVLVYNCFGICPCGSLHTSQLHLPLSIDRYMNRYTIFLHEQMSTNYEKPF